MSKEGCGDLIFENDNIKCGEWSGGDQHFCNKCFNKEESSTLEHYFGLCKKGKAGVIPYSKGQQMIEFVWNNEFGFGRRVELTLNEDGMEEALELYNKLKEKWDAKRRKNA